jgi:hypothetical protein
MDLIGKTVRWEGREKLAGQWFTARVISNYDDEFGGYDLQVVDPGTFWPTGYRRSDIGDILFVHLDWLTVIDSEPDTQDPECE